MNTVGAAACYVGANTNKQLAMLAKADILLFCCSTKPYELLPHIQKIIAAFEDTPAFNLCPFVVKQLKDTYAAYLKSQRHQVLFMEYQPELFDGKTNERQFKSVIQKYLAGE